MLSKSQIAELEKQKELTRFFPHVTVCAVIEKSQKFLLVEEKVISGEIMFNQPAGHLEADESLLSAVCREVREETAREFFPQNFLGVYHWKNSGNSQTFVRFTFVGEVGEVNPNLALDEGIIQTHWLSFDEILLLSRQQKLRSPLILQSIKDYLKNVSYPLDVIQNFIV